MAPGEQRDDHAAHGLGHTDHHGIQGIFEREGALPPVREQVVGGHGGEERVAPGDEGLWGSIQPKWTYGMWRVPLASVVSPIICRSALASEAHRGVASLANTLGMGCAMRLALRSDGCAQPTTSDR